MAKLPEICLGDCVCDANDNLGHCACKGPPWKQPQERCPLLRSPLPGLARDSLAFGDLASFDTDNSKLPASVPVPSFRPSCRASPPTLVGTRRPKTTSPADGELPLKPT